MRCAAWLLIAGLLGCGDDGSEAAMFESPRKREARVERKVAEAQRRLLERERERLELEKQAEVRVELPPRPAQETDPSRMSLVIDIGDGGAAFVNGNVIGDDELDLTLRSAYTRQPDTQVVIRAGRTVTHGRVVQIMEMAKAVGLTRLAIATAPTPPPPP